VIDAFAELTLEARDPARLGLWTPGEKAPRGDPFGPTSRGDDEGGLHDGEDLKGNVVEVWDFFSRGDGAREGVEALR
jgi:hypothetical protein